MGAPEPQPIRARARSLTGFVVGLTGATALIVAGIFVLLLISVVAQRNQNDRARRTSDLLVQADVVERSTVDLETGLRGFLITRQPAFLQPYTQARERLGAELAVLERTAAGQLELAEITLIRSSIVHYINGYAEPLVATAGHLSPRRVVEATARGKQMLDRLRAEFTTLTRDELAQRKSLRASADAQSNRGIAIASAGLAISLLLLGLLSAYLVARILRPTRTVARAAARLADGDLTARVPEVGLGEVAELAQSFNAMGTALQRRDADLDAARRQLQEAVVQAEDAATMKSNFLANMSHEIRTPLNGVVGMMDLLAGTELSDEQREYVTVARTSGDALMNVVNDVLDIAKIEAGGLELERRDFDLHDLVETSCDMVAASALGKGLMLQSYVHEDVPRRTCGDRTRVGQILANLLSNAVKFTAEGEIVLEVTLQEQTEARLTICFQVRDTGIGIEPERAAELFEAFVQAEAGTTRAYGGTGLGLTIVRELTQMMGGSVDVRSQPHRGSTFSVRIPFEPVPDRAAMPAPELKLDGLHVLIVDDNATNRRIFEAYAASWGMRPALVPDADAAIEALRAAAQAGEPFELVLLDHNMPGRSGIDLARQIHAMPELHSPRLILLTSSGQSSASDPSIGLDVVLGKPIRQSRLLDAIATTMGGEPTARPVDTAAGVPPVATTGGEGRRVLVAEDQPVNAMLIERMLEKRGHSPVRAANGREALQRLAAEPFDLVLMDCQMPVMDGYQATRAIRRREAVDGGRHLTVVAMTANAMPGDRERCLAAGMDDYLPKPITADALEAILARWIERGPDSSPRAVDRSRLQEFRELFPGSETAVMLTELERDVEMQLARASAALERQEWTEVRAAAHRILGSARMVGATALGEAAADLEHRAVDGGPGAHEAEGLLRARWEAVRVALSAEALRGDAAGTA
jgi:two-component system sensor histidine kinase/response regulator